MSLQTALVAIKSANSALSTLIGTRFHPNKLEQGEILPAVRFQEISRTFPDYAFSGRPQLANIRVQLDGYAMTQAQRTTLRTALIGCFLPTTRVSGSYGSETVLDIRIIDGDDGLEMLGTKTEAYRCRMDLMCDFQWSATL